MVLGWRRAFCTSIPRERKSAVIKEKQEHNDDNNPTPRLGAKFRFFSTQSTNRLQSEPVSNATVPIQAVPECPKLHSKTKNSNSFFNLSNQSSPRSPSTFSLLKSSLSLTKVQSRCGICLQSVKTEQGIAIFKAECSHSFHFPCIVTHVKNQGGLICPVCRSQRSELPVLAIDKNKIEISSKVDVQSKKDQKLYVRSGLKIYNDDEPLMSPISGARFNPIPELDEIDENDENVFEEFQGFFVKANDSPVNSKSVEVKLSPDAAVISMARSYETRVIVLKVRAPPAPAKTAARHMPIDLVTVLDLGGDMRREKMKTMKRYMRLVVSSLSTVDRLSIVAFSGGSKRLLSLRRMTSKGRSSARRIVDALVACQGTSSVSDALKKATKVLEDRRQTNPVATIIILSDGHKRKHQSPPFVSSTRFAHLNAPIHLIDLSQLRSDDVFAKCINNLLNVVVEDLRLELKLAAGSAPAEIAEVYSYSDRAAALESGSIRFGDLYAEEEREVLIELKVPISSIGSQHLLAVRSCYKDSLTQGLIYAKEQTTLVPRPLAVRSSNPSIERLRNLFVTTRAVAESRRLIERNNLAGAHHLLSSARALLVKSRSGWADEFVRSLEAELAELHSRREDQIQQIQRWRTNVTERRVGLVDEKGEPLTPMSAWRTAEKLAKVAIMRKSMNRVSDLHGFEDARF